MAKELRVIAPIVPAGDFEVANAKDIKAGDKRLDVALAEAAAEVAKKANKTDVNNELNKKASTEYVNAELSKKADKTDVAAELVTKANKIDTETALAGKASVEGLASANEAIADLSTEQAALSARMDTFTRLEEGSTTGDAELADGRVGADGKTYENIGGAIRGQVTGLKSDLSNLDYLQKWKNSDLVWELGGYSSTTGEKGATGGRTIRTQKMPISSGQQITFNIADKDSSGTARLRYAHLWMIDESYKGRYAAVNPFTIEEGVGFVAFEYGYSSTSEKTIESEGGIDAVSNDWHVEIYNVIDTLCNSYPYKDKTIVCFGDSRTWYDGNDYISTCKEEWKGKTCVGYESVMREILLADVINEGISGQSSVQICERIRSYDFTDVDAVLIEGGTNDPTAGTDVGELNPIGSDFNTDTIIGAYQSAVEYVINNYPDVKIFMTIPAKCWTSKGLTSYDLLKVKGDVANVYNIPCIDLYNNVQINELNRDYYYADATNYVHFNDFGNRIIGEAISNFILCQKTDADYKIYEIGCEIKKLYDYNLLLDLTHNNATHNGVTFEWDEKYMCSVSGTTTATAYNDLYASSTSFPEWMKSGDTFYLETTSTDENINLRMSFYLPDGTEDVKYYKNTKQKIVIPNDATGISIRIYVLNGKTVNGTISAKLTNKLSQNEISEKVINIENMIDTSIKPKGLFTFIDDDGYAEQVENWLDVSKVTGIKITECVVTGWTDGEANPNGLAPYIKPLTWDEIRKYQGTGFEFVSHSHNHVYFGGANVGTESDLIADVEASQKALLEHGCNHEFLVYPGGHHDDTDGGIVDNVVRSYFKGAVAISEVANTTPLYTYSIFRHSILDTKNGKSTVIDSNGNSREVYPIHELQWFKDLIDDAIANDKWVVFMSHLYNYGNYYYNDDLKNRLVEVAKYITSNGGRIMRLSDAFENRKNRFESAPRSKSVSYIVDRNGTVFDKQ